MCGIAGFNLTDVERGRIDSRRLSEALLLQIVSRGRDATGAAWSQSASEKPGLTIYYAKQPVPAPKFVPALRHMPRGCRSVILHTRFATKGDPADEVNNHPIVLPGIVGVHNGHLRNDDEIIARYGEDRVGAVDSEAAFRLLASDDRHPTVSLADLRGRAALAWMHVDDPRTLHLARVAESPLWIGQTGGGSVVFASTQQHLLRAAHQAKVALDEVWEVPERTYIRVSRGVIHDVQAVTGSLPLDDMRLFDIDVRRR